MCDFAKQHGLHSSRYNEHMKKALELDSHEKMQTLAIPWNDSRDGSRINYTTSTIPTCEALTNEIADKVRAMVDMLAEQIRADKMPP